MNSGDLHTWSRQLRTLAQRTLGVDWPADPAREIAEFADEFGYRPMVVEPLLRWVFRGGPANPSLPAIDADPSTMPPLNLVQGDVALWHRLTRGTDPIESLLEPGTSAPLLHHPPETSIEVRTEAELAALHALWHHAKQSRRPDLRTRCLNAAAWHIDNLQPDNATNHPWAIHIFAIRAHELSDMTSSLYAQTLLHNCQVNLGRPDRLSAVILLDASQALEA